MRFYLSILIAFLLASLAACGSGEPASPLQTFKTYTKALKAKDVAAMKVLLSNETIKMHEQEAKAQGVPLDDIIKRETLISPDQATVEYRNEKIEGEKATLEVKNSYGSWETLPFVKEDGAWKIDKKGYADQLEKDVEESDKKLEELIDQGRQP